MANFTLFFDMNTCDQPKTDFRAIVIESGFSRACEVFEDQFGVNPMEICPSCGRDYLITEFKSIGDALSSLKMNPGEKQITILESGFEIESIFEGMPN